MIKVLYFDTNAIIKYFLREKGSDLIRWIVDNRVSHAIALHTSQTALYEFKTVLKRKEKNGEITNDQLKRIISKSKPYFASVFRIPDGHKVPGFKSGKDTSHREICEKYWPGTNKNSRDARHLSCVINYLRCFARESRPYIVTADINFGKIIKAEGYDIINPEKITKSEAEMVWCLNQ